MPVTVTVEDHGFDRVWRELEATADLAVEAGLFDPEQAQKGAWNEFGTKASKSTSIAGGDDNDEETGTKPRPWLSVAGDNSAQAYASAMGTAYAAVCDGANPRMALQPVADLAGRSAQEVITTGRVGGPALKSSTVARKASKGRKSPATKLLDSGDMLAAIEGRVVDGTGDSIGGQP